MIARSLLLFVLAGLWCTAAAAQETAAGETAVFALIIGNNRSQDAVRPDLRYADDDALQYGALWQALTESGHTRVLTTVDVDSARAATSDVDGPPTVAAVRAAALALQTEVRRAEAEGKSTQLYFVFAGHGDVQHGKGVLELEDGLLTSGDLKTVLDLVGAETTHVLLDSCNSFFVLYPRRPGGAVIASSDDLSGGITLKRGKLGVFLSTSSEAQVYEWSQLEAGIFSHVVRSALSGAADANADGAISYRELNGFVSVATRDLGNAQYRPRTFMHAPGSDDDIFLDLGASRGSTLALSGFDQRVTVRDETGRRLLDVHPEARFSPSLRLSAASVEVLSSRVEGGRRVLAAAEVIPASTAVIEPGMLAPTNTPRGSEAQLALLFSSAFGPTSLVEVEAARKDEPPQVFGITLEQEERFHAALQGYAARHRELRMLGVASGLLSGSLALGSSAILALQLSKASQGQEPPLLIGSLGGVGLLGGAVLLYSGTQAFTLTEPEKWLLRYDDRPHRTDAERLARVSEAVNALAAEVEEIKSREWIDVTLIASGGVIAASGLTIATAHALASPPATFSVLGLTGLFVGQAGVVLAGIGLQGMLVSTPAEAFFDDLRRDPTSVVPAVLGDSE